MSRSLAAFVELVLVFGAVLAWACWELHVLRRAREARERAEAQQDAPPVKPGAAS